MPVSNPRIKEDPTDASWDLEVTNLINKLEKQLSELDSSGVTTSSIPSGLIAMWHGTIADIPNGWYLCNGSNNTPNLQDKFIVGAGSSYAVENTGGSADAIVVSHAHSFSESGSTANGGGSHTHTATDNGHEHFLLGPQGNFNDPYSGYLVGGSAFYYGGTSGLSPEGYKSLEGSADITVDSANISHNHSFSISGNTDSAGSNGTNANLPPYYSLYYIMKG